MPEYICVFSTRLFRFGSRMQCADSNQSNTEKHFWATSLCDVFCLIVVCMAAISYTHGTSPTDNSTIACRSSLFSNSVALLSTLARLFSASLTHTVASDSIYWFCCYVFRRAYENFSLNSFFGVWIFRFRVCVFAPATTQHTSTHLLAEKGDFDVENTRE